MSTVLGLPVVLIDRGSTRPPDPHRLFAAGGRGEWKAPPRTPLAPFTGPTPAVCGRWTGRSAATGSLGHPCLVAGTAFETRPSGVGRGRRLTRLRSARSGR